MLPMLLVLSAWTIDLVYSHPADTANSHAVFLKKSYGNKDYTTESGNSESSEEVEIEKMQQLLLHKLHKHPQMKLRQSRIGYRYKRGVGKRHIDDDMDSIYRADAVSQFVADMFVNTDEEITALQVTEPDDENPGKYDYSDGEFFNALMRREMNTTKDNGFTPDPSSTLSTTLD